MDGAQKHFDLITPNTTPTNFGRDLARQVCNSAPELL